MNRTSADTRTEHPENPLALLQRSLDAGLRTRTGSSPVPVYFRADDIGVISGAFVKLMTLFEQYKTPLCLAVVPAWLTTRRWSAMSQICNCGSSLWCWHQHGWRHRNHQCSGEKERVWFRPLGSSHQGRYHQRPQPAPGVTRQPFLTLFHSTLESLQPGGGDRASRGRVQGHVIHWRDPDLADRSLPDLPVNVDLHTRKERDGLSCLLALAAELETAAGHGAIGFMIHHQRMSDMSFTLLKGLLDIVRQTSRLTPVDFRDLV